MEKFEIKPETKKENIQEVEEVKFEDLDIGDKLIIYTSDNPEKELGTTYEIEADKIAKTREGKIKYLDVSFKYFTKGYKDSKEREEFVAKMPGGFVKFKPKDNITPGVIRKEENNCLYFENVNFKNRFEDTKSGKRRMRSCSSERTTPIRKILLIREINKEI